VVALGIAIGGELHQLPELARRAEAAGYESVWVAETARSAFVQATLVAQATERVIVGTAVALAFPRSPAITAMAARDLAELSGGRFVLGLGSQVKRINEQRFSVPFEHPAPKMAEAVEAIRAVLGAFGGHPLDHRGRFYNLTMPPFPGAGPAPGPVPIYLAAVNVRMAEAAGRIADGICGHPMTSPRYVGEVLRPAVVRGARAAGRDPADVSLTTNLIAQVDEDGETARREAALQVAFYATTRTYAPVLAMHGFEDRQGPLRKAFARGDTVAMTDLALPMVDALAAAGTPDEVWRRVGEFEGVADRVILGPAWIGPSPERARESFELLLEAFAGRRPPSGVRDASP
jgi:probable F420-dependent oxidoreductase